MRPFLLPAILLATLLIQLPSPAGVDQPATPGNPGNPGNPATPATPATPAARPFRGLIETGWDTPTPRQLRDNLAVVKTRPFDGLIINLTVDTSAGQPCSTRDAFSATPWKREWFQSAVDDLRACRAAGLTENLVGLNANPADIDWFDDAAWAQVLDHWRIAARVAHESGCLGILFDPEAYVAPHAAFRYAAQPQHDRHTFAQYVAQVRLRGRQVTQALAQVQPDITLFCYFLNAVNAPAAMADDPDTVLESASYGLLPAFLNGWLDGAAPTLTIVEGCEMSYLYDSRLQFLEGAQFIRGRALRLVAPENHAKYRAQVRTSFGIYLDAYVNPAGSPWYIGPRPAAATGAPSRLDHLAANVATALDIADAPVWVYGEKHAWWPTPGTSNISGTWPEALPGCDAALAEARLKALDPAALARQQLAAAQAKHPNLLTNGNFSAPAPATSPGNPPGWNTWLENPAKGRFSVDAAATSGGATSGGGGTSSAALATGVKEGCLLQSLPVKTGQRFAVAARARQTGSGNTWLRIRWQSADQKWLPEDLDTLVAFPRRQGQWTESSATVRAPDGAATLLIMLGVSAQEKPTDRAWFTDARLYPLD